ncbi:Rac-like GTP-binding protein [Acrasis kona]|uniref:Rac-like GTP-binding protein n=1 Tax=Acrasis kona TaxID=1008807 RepID=A0AAW2ZQZ0_9EUKA
MARIENVKLMTVGDGAVGKTSLLMSFAMDKFPEEYEPTVFDNYTCTMVYSKAINVQLGLWDTAGQDDYEQMRPLAYPGTHVFLICFSLVSRNSFENISSHWIKEVRTFSKDVPVVICGTKMDMVEDSQEKIGREEGESLAKSLGAHAYVECSGKTQKHMTEVFRQCCEAGLIFQNIIKNNGASTPATPAESKDSEGCCLIC